MNKFIRWSSIALVLFIASCNLWIVGSTKNKVVSDTQLLLDMPVGLVLGTSNQLSNGDPNPFFHNRIDAAHDLIKSGKVNKLLLSGSRDSIFYDEAEMMKKALVKKGVAVEKLILDKEGTRTLTSIKRLKEHHGYSQCIIVTQSNHAYRSLFLAKHLELDAYCYAADPPNVERHYNVMIREIFARTKAIIDVYLLEA